MADPKTNPKTNAKSDPDADFESVASKVQQPAPKKEPTPEPPKTILCEIQRDYWDADGVRHPKKTRVKVSVEAALDGIESGALKRVKSDD